MPTATDDKIRSTVESLSVSLQAARDALRQPLLEKGEAISDALRRLEQGAAAG